MTVFDPARHGFRFANTFHFDVVPELDLRGSGLCGGMVYGALDYFHANRTPPQQDYRPANGTPLYEHLYQRQVESVTSNVDKWAEVGINPFGARNGEFFRWGLQGFGGGRLEELMRTLNARNPVPLGLQDYGSGSGNHQVLAIGYELGRYQGRLGEHQEDLRIFVYDPNYPTARRTLRPSLAEEAFCYAEQTGQKWRTYFVNKNYKAKTPPEVELPGAGAGTVRQVLLEILTGGDDLRGGEDNVNVSIALRNRADVVKQNANGGKRWIDNYAQTVAIAMPAGTRLEDLQGVTLSTTFGGGVGGDNWNIDGLKAMADMGSERRELVNVRGRPLFRFTGEKRTFSVDFQRR